MSPAQRGSTGWTVLLVLGVLVMLGSGTWAVVNHRSDGPLWVTTLMTVVSLVAVVGIAAATRRAARG